MLSFSNFKTNCIKGMLSTALPGGDAGNLSILMFHKVPVVADPLVPDELCMLEFETILDFLHSTVRVLPLVDALGSLKRGTLPSRSVAITFDDGYAEWTKDAASALARRSMPATFFITTEVLAGKPLWHERIVAAVRALPAHGTQLPFGFSNYTNLSTNGMRTELIRALQQRLKYAPLAERLAIIATLEAQVVSALQLPPNFCESDVRALHSLGFGIGAHTVQHPILNECTYEEATAEIGGCKEALEGIIRGKVELFAYPNGRPTLDYLAKHAAMVKAAGYIGAVSTSAGVATRQSDLYQLPRTASWGSSHLRMAYHLIRNRSIEPGLAKSVSNDASGSINGRQQSSDVRCLLISSTFAPIRGGSAVVYHNLCVHMPADSIRVLAASKNYLNNKQIEGWQKHDQSASYPIDRIPLLRPLMPPPASNILVSLYRLVFLDLALYARCLWYAARLVRKHRINVVCVGDLVTGSWLGFALRRLFGCKVIIYIHGEEVTTQTGGRLHGNRRGHNLRNADKVVAVSSFTCDALTDDMAVQPDRLALLQNGVDTDHFTPGPVDHDLLAKHGLARTKIVLTVGRLVPRKGIDMSIRAMRLVVNQMPNVHHLIIGEGSYRQELEKIIAQEDMAAYVTLLGKTSDDDLLRYLRSCDVFLMPNRTMPDGDTEGFGLVFREANACRKPVIGGRAGGAVEAVMDGESGILVDGGNPVDIANALLLVLGDPAVAERLAANGLKLAQENNVKTVADRFLKICERILTNPVTK